ncbi:UDP-2,4-diacetamido-2,4,6-trideoxy-beta-L-altropyranose hydrolase [Herbaspirillum sp. meg3]|uniref:UDP-2,4-diacetamido-2,4, 6-trideoxy-beta-L-altropyranose hydrolase n=1 Tax=Herbaspirillum sp. meg3 TaxID=2025949 RepID=UPI000B99086A|nr:UDP-2,4-diacetamido-2,4,6-trideoxy-beta-L-altropyranose hydrolase [Herbaspirillum sp. meg3]ASU40580.1 UDP-2,4-diacetamido-2,4,6-trideoxy-beta-L-altropyranose hydrolase [Herbaspirillum sp. meg3]
MKVAIRLDASPQIGVGHLMRCLTLADALRDRGAVVYVLARDLALVWQQRIAEHGHHHLSIVSGAGTSSTMLLDWQSDAYATKECLLSIGRVDWIIVDHYELDIRWEQIVRDGTVKVMVIDDLANRRHDCDVLLDQNFFENPLARYDGLVPAQCVRLLGPSYALLRNEFASTRELGRRVRHGPLRVLLSFGGSDPTGETLKVLREMQQADVDEVEFDVVVGASNPAAPEIAELCCTLPRVNFLFDVKDMAALMYKADVFLGAGGTTTWERCCLGLPGIVVATASNQIEGAEALGRQAVHLYLGDCSFITGQDMMAAVRILKLSQSLRQAFGIASKNIVDGRGAMRVVSALIAPPVSLRPAIGDDCERLFAWRNDPAVRRSSFNQDPLEWESHARWFEATLRRPDRILLVAEMEGDGGGVLRYDLDGYSATVSVYLAPDSMGKGLGAHLLATGSSWMEQHHPQIVELIAAVMPDNKASISAFLKAGFDMKHFIFRKEQNHGQ